ncbi:plasmid stabilization protein [Xenophilus aerolatus]|nr:plasmid stabilization protein [Xenophilus aerolatus]
MRALPVRLRPLAQDDADDAIAHYVGEQAIEAALGFVDALEAACAHIGRHAGTGSTRHAHELQLPGLRCWRLTRFPYLLFYMAHEDHIDVWRVLHERRDIAEQMQD